MKFSTLIPLLPCITALPQKLGSYTNNYVSQGPAMYVPNPVDWPKGSFSLVNNESKGCVDIASQTITACKKNQKEQSVSAVGGALRITDKRGTCFQLQSDSLLTAEKCVDNMDVSLFTYFDDFTIRPSHHWGHCLTPTLQGGLQVTHCGVYIRDTWTLQQK